MLIQLRPSTRKDKKYMAIFDDYKPIHFGAKNYEDYTSHKDPQRKERYIKRHSKEDWNDPYTPATLSRYILWEYPDLSEAAVEYNKRFFKNKFMKYIGGIIPTDEKLYEEIKKKADLMYDKPSAYKSGYIIKEYKKNFISNYPNKEPFMNKPTKLGLKRWFEEEWKNQRGEIGYSKKGDIYRPSKRITEETPTTWDELNKKEIKEAIKEKKETGRVKKFKQKSAVHSIVFPKETFTTSKAKKWLEENNYKPIKEVHETLNTYRYRILPPEMFKSFITKKLKNNINLVIGFL